MKKRAKVVRKPVKRRVSVPIKKEGLKLVAAVRHGEYTDWGKKGLDDLGQHQSQLIAQKLRKIIPSEYSIEVFSSTHARGQETATILASHLGATVKVLGELCSDEFIDGEVKRQAVLKGKKVEGD